MTKVVGAGGHVGANCTLSYPRDGKTYAYRVRIGKLQHGIEQIADESQGRLRRAFYPHRLTNAQFSIGLILDGTRLLPKAGKAFNSRPNEYEKFMTWLHSYMSYMLLQDESIENDLPRMTVSVPNYKFSREGIPLGPVLFGDHVASMIWTPTIVFETTRDYLEPHDVPSSRFLGGYAALDKNSQFSYPSSPQLLGDEVAFGFDQGQGGLSNIVPTPEDVQAAATGEN